MERHELLEMMAQLKLAGMRTAYDEILADGLKRRHPVQEIIGTLLTRLPQLGGREDANPLIFLDRNIKGRHYRAPNGGGGSSAVRRRSAARAVAAGSCRAGAAVARACAGGRPPAWPFRCSHDAAPRPSRGPGNRASGREGRKGDSGHHGTGPSTAPLGYVERQLVRVTQGASPVWR